MKRKKILMISLLRVGDLISHKVIFDQIKRKHGEADYFLLTNDSCKSAEGIFNEFKKIFYFPRVALQKSMGEKNAHLFSAHYNLIDFVNEVSKESYDFSYNLTPNKLSALLHGQLDSKYKKGVFFKAGIPQFTNSWSRFYNDYQTTKKTELFNNTDIIRWSLDLKDQRDENKKLETKARSGIFFQVLSSDVRKNWPVASFIETVTYAAAKIKRPLYLLYGPGEESLMQPYLAELQMRKLGIIPLCLSFSDLEKDLEKAELLVSVDTSIKHLGAHLGVRVLEIALGPADTRVTGVYPAFNYILQPTLNCFPCRHSSSCEKSHFECKDHLNGQILAEIILNILENKDESIGKIVRSGKNNFSIQKTYNLQGIWVSLNLDRPMTAEDIQKIIRKINLYNEMEPEDPISMDSLYQACQKNNLEVEKHEIEANFKVVSLNSKNQLDQAYGLLKQIKQFSRIKKDASELKSFLKLAKTWNQGSHGYVYQLPVANKIEDNFMFLRSLQMRLNQFIEENENKHHVSRSASQREVTNEEG